MSPTRGARITVESEKVGAPQRQGEILEIIESHISVRYRVPGSLGRREGDDVPSRSGQRDRGRGIRASPYSRESGRQEAGQELRQERDLQEEEREDEEAQGEEPQGEEDLAVRRRRPGLGVPATKRHACSARNASSRSRSARTPSTGIAL
jgi:hypothetical protein